MAVYAFINGVDCRTCFSGMQKQRGCNEPTKDAIKIGRFTTHKCPRSYAKGVVLNYIDAYQYYKNGLLPNEGTYLKQPAKYLQAMNIIASVISENEGE